MRLSSLAVALLSVGAAHAAFGFGDSQAPIVADNHVPGKSPLEFCVAEQDSDIVHIERVDIDPNPPQAGQVLKIDAVGVVKETIEAGAYIDVVVKYGLIRLISTRVDLCDSIKNIGLECPIKPGLMRIQKAVELPREIPPGKYNVMATVLTAEGMKITCLTATVTMGNKPAGLFPSFEL